MSTTVAPLRSASSVQRIAPYKILDIFRGLAALWVVMRHCSSSWPLLAAELAHHSAWLYRFSLRGQLGVCIFFVISGYCITGAAYSALVSGKSVGRYCYERARRIYPPYLVTILLGLVFLLGRLFAQAHRILPLPHHPLVLPSSPAFWAGNLLLCQIPFGLGLFNVVFWSLCYEVFFYAVIGVFLAIARYSALVFGLSRGTCIFVLLIFLSTDAALLNLTLSGHAIFPFDKWHQFSIGGILFFALEFGPQTVAVYSRRFRFMILSGTLVAAALTILFAIVRSHTDELTGNLDSSRLRSILCLGFALLLYFLRKHDSLIASSRIAHPLLWLGGGSYSLYLTHTIFIPYVSILGRKAGLDGSLYWVTFLLQILVAVAAGRLFYRLVESRFISSRQRIRLATEGIA